MLHLLDANVLIDADRDYYPIERVPEFWSWLQHQGETDAVKIPEEIYEEITAGRGDLSQWAKDSDVEAALLLNEEVDVRLVQRAVNDGYARNLTDVQVESLGQDPFLIAHCLSDPTDRCVVTTESSRPSRQPHNRHLPDACHLLRINCIHTFEFVRIRNFRTDWRRH